MIDFESLNKKENLDNGRGHLPQLALTFRVKIRLRKGKAHFTNLL